MAGTGPPGHDSAGVGNEGGDAETTGERDRRLGASLLAIARTLRVEEPTDLEWVARVVVENATRLVDGTEGVVALVDTTTPRALRVVAAHGPWATGLIGAEWPLDRTAVAGALEDGVALEHEQVRGDLLLDGVFQPERVAGIRLIPLGAGGAAQRGGRTGFGILGFVREHGGSFGRAERDLMDNYARLVVGMLHHAALAAAAERGHREAEQANRIRSDLTSTVAHELRTPLTVISGFVSLLCEGDYGPAPASWEQPIAIVAAKVNEMQKLVEDLLTASRIESGLVPVSLEALDLCEVVRDAIGRARARAALMQGEVVDELPHQPVPVAADLGHLDRILDNLLNNALTYGGERPWVRVTVADSKEPTVAIEDHGTGIPAEMHERIFERFVRVQEQGAGQGSGLGLYISRQLAERVGGLLLLARSEVGRGSCFELRLLPAEASIGA